MDQEPSPDDALVDLLQAADGDFADVYARACVHGQGHVQHLGGRVFIRHRRIDGGERVTVFLERRKQALLCVQYLRGYRRIARCNARLDAKLFGYFPLDRHLTEAIQRTDLHRHRDRGFGLLGQLFDSRGEARVVKWPPADRDGDASLIVAKAPQHGLQAIDVLLRAPYEGKGTDRRRGAQRFELRAPLERGVERAVSGGREADSVGLRVCSMGDRQDEARNRGENERSEPGMRTSSPVRHLARRSENVEI